MSVSRRVLATLAMLVAVAVIGAVDVWSGHDYGMSLFYLIPVSVAAWWIGRAPGAILATAAAVAWTVADLFTGGTYKAIPVTASLWNGFTRLVIFNVIAYLLDRLRQERDAHIEVNKLREQLLYSVAHELRGPLGVLENALDILSEEYGDLSTDEFARISGSARRTAARLRTLMEDLLSAGSIQSGRFRVDPVPVPLDAIVADAVDAAAQATEAREQTIEVELAAPITVRADRRYARQVLANLLNNASRYGPQGSAIRVSATAANGEARVVVEDHGVGIPRETQNQLFQRFYRPKAEGPGIGLGLAIAKGIVEAHGGRIGLESEPGRGTTVWFTLPTVA